MHPPRHTPTDAYPTATSLIQLQLEEVLLTHLELLGAYYASNTPPLNLPNTPPLNLSKSTPLSRKIPTRPLAVPKTTPILNKGAHLRYAQRNLFQGFPSTDISQDTSQSWLIFWTLQTFALCKAALDEECKQRAIDSIMRFQHPDGGFGGGPGHAPHLLSTYAAVCALAIVGRPGPGGSWDQIDREKMYKFFLSLKQPDGSFLVARGAEVDKHSNIVTPELIAGTAEFIASCQTYEGGFASASQPYFSSPAGVGVKGTLLDDPHPPLGEAHGGYTFCALACWVLLKPLLPPSTSTSTHTVNERSLRRWLANMQGLPIELGGFKGRTNKLVDGCYSWWVGGAFGLLDALAAEGGGDANLDQQSAECVPIEEGDDGKEDEWSDVDEVVFNRQALQEYILLAGQHPDGGLRDKPPKHPDAYHTLYCLSGLSAAQHRVYRSEERRRKVVEAWIPSPDDANDEIHQRAYAHALSYVQDAHGSHILGGAAANGVNASHPIFNLTITHTEFMMRHFYKQPAVPR